MGGRPVSIQSYKTTGDLAKIIKSEIDGIKQPCNVTAWMDLIRTARQPQTLWRIDYIEPREELFKVNDLIRESEQYLYANKTDLTLMEGYTADISQQIAFNTIRARLRSEEGDIQTSIAMFSRMLKEWYADIPVIRQSNLLFHCCLCFLCCKMFEESLQCLDRHWVLTKYLSPPDRTKLGIWDNHVILQLACWFFAKNSPDFNDYFAIKSKCRPSEVYNHKKIAILNFLSYDHAWIVSFCGIHFYEHARTLMPSLPPFDAKHTTYINPPAVWQSETEWTTEDQDQPRFYHDAYNRLAALPHVTDYDELDNYLYSFYHFYNDYSQDLENQTALYKFLNNNIGFSDYSSVLEAGCGINPLGHSENYVRVDISEFVCGILREKGLEVINSCITTFLKDTNKTFDICFACNILQKLRKERLNIFLKECSKKCSFLVALINTDNDYRDEILIERNDPINMNHTVASAEEWVKILEPHFKVDKFRGDDNFVYVFCSSRHKVKK